MSLSKSRYCSVCIYPPPPYCFCKQLFITVRAVVFNWNFTYTLKERWGGCTEKRHNIACGICRQYLKFDSYKMLNLINLFMVLSFIIHYESFTHTCFIDFMCDYRMILFNLNLQKIRWTQTFLKTQIVYQARIFF